MAGRHSPAVQAEPAETIIDVEVLSETDPTTHAIDPPWTLADGWWARMMRDWPDKELVAYFLDPARRYQDIAQSRADQDVRDQFAALMAAVGEGRHHRQLPPAESPLEALPGVAHEPDDTLTDTKPGPWDDTTVDTKWDEFVADNPVPGFRHRRD